MTNLNGIARALQITIIVVILATGLGLGILVSAQLPVSTRTVTSSFVSTSTQTIVEKSTVVTVTTVTNISEIQSLQEQLSTLTSLLSQQEQEIEALQILSNSTFGGFYIFNQTWTISSNSNYTIDVATLFGGVKYVGTLFFLYNNCANNGFYSDNVDGQFQMIVLLNGTAASGFGYMQTALNTTSFGIYLENSGSQSVSCTGSFYYFHHN